MFPRGGGISRPQNFDGLLRPAPRREDQIVRDAPAETSVHAVFGPTEGLPGSFSVAIVVAKGCVEFDEILPTLRANVAALLVGAPSSGCPAPMCVGTNLTTHTARDRDSTVGLLGCVLDEVIRDALFRYVSSESHNLDGTAVQLQPPGQSWRSATYSGDDVGRLSLKIAMKIDAGAAGSEEVGDETSLLVIVQEVESVQMLDREDPAG